MHNPDPEPLLCSHVEAKGVEGSIPPGGWPLPASLTGLYLDGNNISGPIPEDFSLPEGLLVLLLSSNQLSAQAFLPAALLDSSVGEQLWVGCMRACAAGQSHFEFVVWRWYSSCTPALLPSCCRPGLTTRAGGTPPAAERQPAGQ